MTTETRPHGQRPTRPRMDRSQTEVHKNTKERRQRLARYRAGFLRNPLRYLRIYRVHDELVDHLTRSTPLSRGEALRVIQDVLAYFDETTTEYVRRRHRELQAQGLVNAEIFERIEADLKYRAVAPPELTLRQLRRIVYG